MSLTRKLVLLTVIAFDIGCNHRPTSGLIAVDDRVGQPARQCSTASGYFTNTAIADRESWYGKHLAAMRETPLCVRPGLHAEIYRLTWLPSFNHSVVVRVERDSGNYWLEARSETGAGGYGPGILAHDSIMALTPNDLSVLSDFLYRSNFWNLPTIPARPVIGADGSQWILEGLAGNRYHVVDRWSPQPDGGDSSYRKLGAWLLSKSGLASQLY